MNSILGHFETIAPHFLRRVNGVNFQRTEVDTPDNDFLELDYLYEKKFSDLVIICHGLEGSSNATYVRGLARFFFKRGINVLALNYRSCGGKINKLPRFYHSGETEDLDFCVRWAKKFFSPKKIFLAGFSLGGNLITKYFGERGTQLDSSIIGGAVFSVPLDLEGGSRVLNTKFNKMYEQNFLITLKAKVLRKKRLGIISDEINMAKLLKSTTLFDFDNLVTAPLHGFIDAYDYYKKNSGLYFVEDVARPLLIANAVNDPILSGKSFLKEGQVTKNVLIKNLARGGHVGFSNINLSNEFTSEKMAFDFFRELC
tara:strand:+ start:464 stop:1402 length:939 start_codon:yes stop_codon:yes gene_type:complete